jgi:Domain of unknown function (DUF4386)
MPLRVRLSGARFSLMLSASSMSTPFDTAKAWMYRTKYVLLSTKFSVARAGIARSRTEKGQAEGFYSASDDVRRQFQSAMREQLEKGVAMSHRTIGRIVGALFLAAFVCYGVGSALADRPFGPALMLLNSVVVATIGVLVFRVFRRPHPRTAVTYLVARALEAVLLALGVVLLVSMGSAEGNSLAYQFAMLALGVGSVPFCRTLLRGQFVPGWLAAWGIVGYALLAAGASLELVGMGLGLVLAIPGGLFEVALGVTLIVRGFPEPIGTPPATQMSADNDRFGASA